MTEKNRERELTGEMENGSERRRDSWKGHGDQKKARKNSVRFH